MWLHQDHCRCWYSWTHWSLIEVLLSLLPLGGASVVSQKRWSTAPPAKHIPDITWARLFICDDNSSKLEVNHPNALGQWMPWRLLIQNTRKNIKQNDRLILVCQKRADRFLICKPCVDIFNKTYLKYSDFQWVFNSQCLLFKCRILIV